MLNVNITLESKIPNPPPLTSTVATNIPLFRRKTKKSYFLSYNEYQETSKECHLYNDKVATNTVLNIIKHE